MYLIKKVKIYLALALLVLPVFMMTGVVSAAGTTSKSNVSCDDASTTIAFTPNATKHTLSVACKSGSEIEYIPASGSTQVTINITCPKSTETASDTVAHANAANGSIVYACVIDDNPNVTPTATTDTPTGKASAATSGSVLCSDGVTPAPNDDASQCPSDVDNQGCTTGGANETGCVFNSADCSTQDNAEMTCTDPATVDCTSLSKPQPGINCTDMTCTATSCNLIAKYINPLVRLLSALVGVAVTISIIVGGIQYGSSGGDPQRVTQAKNRIRNSVIALLAFMFLYAFLQFLVPGGIFNR
jgi:hypothetical protein